MIKKEMILLVLVFMTTACGLRFNKDSSLPDPVNNTESEVKDVSDQNTEKMEEIKEAEIIVEEEHLEVKLGVESSEEFNGYFVAISLNKPAKVTKRDIAKEQTVVINVEKGIYEDREVDPKLTYEYKVYEHDGEEPVHQEVIQIPYDLMIEDSSQLNLVNSDKSRSRIFFAEHSKFEIDTDLEIKAKEIVFNKNTIIAKSGAGVKTSDLAKSIYDAPMISIISEKVSGTIDFVFVASSPPGNQESSISSMRTKGKYSCYIDCHDCYTEETMNVFRYNLNSLSKKIQILSYPSETLKNKQECSVCPKSPTAIGPRYFTFYQGKSGESGKNGSRGGNAGQLNILSSDMSSLIYRVSSTPGRASNAQTGSVGYFGSVERDDQRTAEKCPEPMPSIGPNFRGPSGQDGQEAKSGSLTHICIGEKNNLRCSYGG